ncbi:MAG TPA: hypothetical protein VJZ75_04300 [Candidatus Bathyarchaeia archaeon]|nr:hypothetical protein [Candidatus Bathyarchaeia archaeon]
MSPTNNTKTALEAPFGGTNKVFTVTPDRVGIVKTLDCRDCAAPNENTTEPNAPKIMRERHITLMLRINCNHLKFFTASHICVSNTFWSCTFKCGKQETNIAQEVNRSIVGSSNEK